jgi:hypothetical protein
VRPRDPRRIFGRHRQARARVEIIDVPEAGSNQDGSVTTKQEAEVTLPRSELERIWHAEYLERLAATYWRFLTRVSLGILRVLYTPDSRAIAVFGRPLVLLRFNAPEYEIGGDDGNIASVTWRIDRGLLVRKAGRGKGFLRITVRRKPGDDGGELVTGEVSSEVANFYPAIAGSGWFARIGQYVYRYTQLAIHVVVTNAFLRSLARLDLAESKVGSLKESDVPVKSGR